LAGKPLLTSPKGRNLNNPGIYPGDKRVRLKKGASVVVEKS
jgi:hypothetical protein